MEGLDYFETISIVVKMNTIQIFLVIAAAKLWHLEKLGVIHHGDLNENIYMKLPKAYHPLFLTRSVSFINHYYLKQVCSQRYSKLNAAPLSLGYS